MLRLANLGKIKYDFTQSEDAEGSYHNDQDLSTLDIMLRTWRGCVLS